MARMPVSGQIHPVLWDLQLICLRGWPSSRWPCPLCQGRAFFFQVWCSIELQCRLGIRFNLPLLKINILGTRKGAFQPQQYSACLSTSGKALSKIMSKCSQHLSVIPGFHPSIVPVALFFRMNCPSLVTVERGGETLMMI